MTRIPHSRIWHQNTSARLAKDCEKNSVTSSNLPSPKINVSVLEMEEEREMTNGIESNLKTSAQHLKKIKKGKITE
jgi:hypothetical protein